MRNDAAQKSVTQHDNSSSHRITIPMLVILILCAATVLAAAVSLAESRWKRMTTSNPDSLLRVDPVADNAGLLAQLRFAHSKAQPSYVTANGEAHEKALPTLPSLKATFDGAGAHFSGPNSPSLTLRLVAFGRGQYISTVSPVRPKTDDNLVTYTYPRLTECWKVSSLGCEQVFTIATRPRGEGGLVLALEATEKPSQHQGALAWGKLQYSDLAVTDVLGNKVPATLETQGTRILIAVNDARAKYPLTIDPLVSLAHKLTASDGAAGDGFGYSLAVAGRTAIVGAPYATINGRSVQGAAYVFRLTNGTWMEEQKLVANDGASYDNFGNGVALDGKTVIVGAPDAAINGNAGQGAAYVFTESNGIWTQTQKLVATDGGLGNEFGESVALEDGTALVGAIQLLHGPGAAYIFNNTGGTWSQTEKLTAKQGSGTFGDAVALDGDNALIGAQQTAVGGRFDEGAAFVFSRHNGTWRQTAVLVANDGTMFDSLGDSVALDGSTALVGAAGATINGKQKGAAYIFTRTGRRWHVAQRLTASDGRRGDGFGSSVALNGTMALVGADQYTNDGTGKVYVFADSNGAWTQRARLVASDGAADGEFGGSVALDNSTAFIGAWGATVDGNIGEGAVYLGHYPANR